MSWRCSFFRLHRCIPWSIENFNPLTFRRYWMLPSKAKQCTNHLVVNLETCIFQHYATQHTNRCARSPTWVELEKFQESFQTSKKKNPMFSTSWNCGNADLCSLRPTYLDLARYWSYEGGPCMQAKSVEVHINKANSFAWKSEEHNHG